MSDTLAMYVVSNGELAVQALNAVVTLVRTNTFGTALTIGTLFSILGGILKYMHKHDLAVLGKWFVIYFGVTVIMLLKISKPLVVYDITLALKYFHLHRSISHILFSKVISDFKFIKLNSG